MTFWLDAQLDPYLAPWLGSQFRIVVKTLREIGLRDAADVELYEAARRFGPTVIITKDADFAELIARRGSPPQVVWLRCGNLSTVELQLELSRCFGEALADIRGGAPIVELLG